MSLMPDVCHVCDGVGKFEDPQHGMSMHCSHCNGTGVEPPKKGIARFVSGLQIDDEEDEIL